ncbi:hypothetical protein GCM10011614_11940 [Novosphingobium colocasiae]|uniref:Uncharacterized protein n=1 Tax=Novosphingobium colocasiae TaxID=1256513 RepID=A0A918PCH1_9SPHN|nr:hypothetical protein GCM10011614_11940 [Novosphingobium colocasiae]
MSIKGRFRETGSAFFVTSPLVIPAHAGTHLLAFQLGSRVRGKDEEGGSLASRHTSAPSRLRVTPDDQPAPPISLSANAAAMPVAIAGEWWGDGA